MMHSDVLAERDNQIRIKQELNRLERIREEKYTQMMKHNHERLLEREEVERKEAALKKIAVARIQRDQLREAIAKRTHEMDYNAAEGARMKKEFDIQLQDDKQADINARERALKALEETRKSQEHLLKIKRDEGMKQAEHDAKTEAYAQRQEEIQRRRCEREKFVFEEKQRLRQKMIDNQATFLENSNRQAEERVEMQCREADANHDRLDQERRNYQKQLMEAMDRERKTNIERKEREILDQQCIQKRSAEYTKLLLDKLDKEDKDERLQKRIERTRLADFHKKQIEERRSECEKNEHSNHRARINAAKLEAAHVNDFYTHGENVIREYAEQGRNILPMLKILGSGLNE